MLLACTARPLPRVLVSLPQPALPAGAARGRVNLFSASFALAASLQMPAHVSAQEQPAAVPHAGAIVENTRTHSILENTFYINIHKSSPPPYRMQVLYLRTHSILENTFYVYCMQVLYLRAHSILY